MEYRTLGKTGLRVSAIGQGGAAFGDQFGKVTQAEVTACVHRAIDCGINLFDTSPYYGLTRAESALGCALGGGLRHKILLCSKAGRNGAADFDFSPAAMERSVDASLARLGTDYLDLLLAHDIEYAADFEQVFTDTADCLHRLKQKGKCRLVGMSGYPLGILRRAIERCNLDAIISYCHFTLQNQRLIAELLPAAEAHGVGVINASPLAMGLLSEKGPPPWHPAAADLKTRAKQAAAHCRALGTDIAELGMRFCFADKRIPCTITGTAAVAELEANLRAMEGAPDRQLVDAVAAIFGPTLNESWPSGNWKG